MNGPTRITDPNDLKQQDWLALRPSINDISIWEVLCVNAHTIQARSSSDPSIVKTIWRDYISKEMQEGRAFLDRYCASTAPPVAPKQVAKCTSCGTPNNFQDQDFLCFGCKSAGRT